jgi:hypothetical protein
VFYLIDSGVSPFRSHGIKYEQSFTEEYQAAVRQYKTAVNKHFHKDTMGIYDLEQYLKDCDEDKYDRLWLVYPLNSYHVFTELVTHVLDLMIKVDFDVFILVPTVLGINDIYMKRCCCDFRDLDSFIHFLEVTKE